MSPTYLHCPKCKSTLLGGVFNTADFVPCPSCAVPLQVELYPAFFRKHTAGAAGESVMTEGESSCFYHPQKKAVLACESCGRFVCALCDCALQGRHLCPNCLEAGQTKGKIKSLENTRTRYDNLALGLALYPILILYLTLLTAPAVLFIVIRYWKSPLGLTQGSRTRMVVAAVLATLQIAGWLLLFISLFAR